MSCRRPSTLGLLLLALGCASSKPVQPPVAAAPAPPPDAWRTTQPPPLAAVPPFRAPVPVQRSLPNRLTVLLRENHAVPVVVVELAIRTGVDGDPPDRAGLADFVAGALDEGTRTRTSQQLAEQLEDSGRDPRGQPGPGWRPAPPQLPVGHPGAGAGPARRRGPEPGLPPRGRRTGARHHPHRPRAAAGQPGSAGQRRGGATALRPEASLGPARGGHGRVGEGHPAAGFAPLPRHLLPAQQRAALGLGGLRAGEDPRTARRALRRLATEVGSAVPAAPLPQRGSADGRHRGHAGQHPEPGGAGHAHHLGDPGRRAGAEHGQRRPGRALHQPAQPAAARGARLDLWNVQLGGVQQADRRVPGPWLGRRPAHRGLAEGHRGRAEALRHRRHHRRRAPARKGRHPPVAAAGAGDQRRGCQHLRHPVHPRTAAGLVRHPAGSAGRARP